MCVPSPISTKQLYRRSATCPCKRRSASLSSSHQSALEEEEDQPPYKKTTSQQHQQPQQQHYHQQQQQHHRNLDLSQLHQHEYLPLPRPRNHNPPSLPLHRRKRTHPHHHHPTPNHRRVTFAPSSTLHIVTNLTLQYKHHLWLTSEQIARKKRKMVLFAYLLKTKRVDWKEFDDDGLVLMGLERHVYDDAAGDGDDGGADVGGGDASASDDESSDESSDSGRSSSSSTSSRGSRGGSSRSNSRQEVFQAVLNEQHRQFTLGIQDVEALAKVSMGKSQRARDRARVIGMLQSL